MMKIGTRIKEARKGKGWSQDILASKMGVTRSAVSQWESEEGTTPNIDNLAKVAIECDVAFEWLVTGRNSPSIGESAPPAYLKSDEEALLLAFRSMPPTKQKALLALITD